MPWSMAAVLAQVESLDFKWSFSRQALFTWKISAAQSC